MQSEERKKRRIKMIPFPRDTDYCSIIVKAFILQTVNQKGLSPLVDLMTASRDRCRWKWLSVFSSAFLCLLACICLPFLFLLSGIMAYPPRSGIEARIEVCHPDLPFSPLFILSFVSLFLSSPPFHFLTLIFSHSCSIFAIAYRCF